MWRPDHVYTLKKNIFETFVELLVLYKRFKLKYCVIFQELITNIFR